VNIPLRRYGTRSQGISQFYLHTPRSSANGMNHTCLAFPAEAGTHLSTPEGWKAELAPGCNSESNFNIIGKICRIINNSATHCPIMSNSRKISHT